MIKAIDHVGIAVSDLEASKALYSRLFGVTEFHEEVVESVCAAIASFMIQDVRIELVSPLAEDTPLGKYLAKNGDGIHHVAFRSSDLSGDIQDLQHRSFEFINEEPIPGAHDMLVTFLHPKTTGRVLFELCAPKPQP
ncbi:MAG: VOC family protein [Ignavibacteria bacterium]|nr:VOC family protein [Ignavibacteria bacterium]